MKLGEFSKEQPVTKSPVRFLCTIAVAKSSFSTAGPTFHRCSKQHMSVRCSVLHSSNGTQAETIGIRFGTDDLDRNTMKPPSRTIVSPKPEVGDPFEIVPVLPHTPGDGHLVQMEECYHGLLEAAPNAMVVAN